MEGPAQAVARGRITCVHVTPLQNAATAGKPSTRLQLPYANVDPRKDNSFVTPQLRPHMSSLHFSAILAFAWGCRTREGG